MKKLYVIVVAVQCIIIIFLLTHNEIGVTTSSHRRENPLGCNASIVTSIPENSSAHPPLAVSIRDEALQDESNSAEALYTPIGHHYLSASRLNPAGLAPLTQWVQEEIYKHQHPTNCERVLVTEGWHSGIGAEMHVIGSHLAHAIETGQVLVWGERACYGFSHYPCGPSRCSCIFQRISNCTEKPGDAQVSGLDHQRLIPSRFRAAIAEAMPTLTEPQMLYWWQMQCVGYLARMNEETVAEIRQMRLNESLHTFTTLPARSFPLPRGTIGAHIRGGDKKREMRLVEPQAYATAAVHMVWENPFEHRARTLFVSGDDGNSVEACCNAIAARGWTCVRTDITRMEGGYNFFELGRGITDDLRRFTLQVMLQLVMSMEADGWVGTRRSNWNRLVDELRCVWVDKCRGPYTEVGEYSDEDYW